MSNFIGDDTSLPAAKTDKTALPAGEDPNKWMMAADYNASRTAHLDTRDWVKGAVANYFTLKTNSSLPSGAAGKLFVGMDSSKRFSFDVDASGYRGLLRMATDCQINVKDQPYGAKGDGTTDDTAAINSAIYAVGSAGGGTLFFPKGNYAITDDLLIRHSGVRLLGEGQGVSKISVKTTWNTVPFTGAITAMINVIGDYTGYVPVEGVTIEGLHLVNDPDATDDAGTGQRCISGWFANRVKLINCTFEDCPFPAIAPSGNPDDAHNSGCSKWIVENCYFLNDGGAADGGSCVEINGHEWIVANNRFEDCFSAVGASYGPSLISGNVILDPGGIGISAGSDVPESWSNRIVGNYIRCSTDGAVAIVTYGQALGTIIENNAIDLIGPASGTDVTGIRAISSPSVRIANNVVNLDGQGTTTCRLNAIVAQEDLLDADIDGNLCTGRDPGAGQGGVCLRGIVVSCTAPGTAKAIVRNNKVLGWDRVASSYSFDIRANGSGTVTAVCAENFQNSGYVNISPLGLIYDGSLDNVFWGFDGTAITFQARGSNHGDVTLAAVGSTPSANGASLSTQVLTLQPADGTYPGLLTAGAQTIGGVKTLSAEPVFSAGVQIPTAQALKLNAGGTSKITDSSGDIRVDVATGKAFKLYVNSVLKATLDTAAAFVGAVSGSNLSGTNTGDVTIGTANGLSISSQALSMAAAGSATTGAVTSSAQSFGGVKTFDAEPVFSVGIQIPTANALKLNAGGTTKLADASGDMRADVASGKAIKVYENSGLILTIGNGSVTLGTDLHLGLNDLWAKKIIPDSSSALQLNGRTGDSAGVVGVQIGQNSALTAGADRFIAGFYTDNGTTVKSLVASNGDFVHGSTSGPRLTSGSGTPEGAVSAPLGSIYMNTAGGANVSHYVKESGGSGNTGWVAK